MHAFTMTQPLHDLYCLQESCSLTQACCFVFGNFFWGGEGNWAISLFMTLPELKICHDYLKILNGMATALYNQVTA